jgi:multiple sugar transport system substrate-binding protein
MKHWNRAVALLSAAAVVVALGACSAGDVDAAAPQEVSKADIDKAMSTPTKLVFWSSLGTLQSNIDMFEKKYPDIDIELVNPGSSTEYYTKLTAALQTGTNVPDVVQLHGRMLSTYVASDDLVDLRQYGADELEKDFTPYAWQSVTAGDGVYAIPQDGGPMALLYRSDLYEKAGVTPAATYAEFAKNAEAIKSSTGAYIANFPSNEPYSLTGLLLQDGITPFDYDGKETVTINVNDPRAKELMGYWSDLIEKDLVSTDAWSTDTWYQGMSQGRYASWLTAAWGPVFLTGTAENTAGLWRAAKLPQWKEGDDSSGLWGGSVHAVTKASKHQIAAAEFVKFLNDDPDSVRELNKTSFLFPTQLSLLDDPGFRSEPSDFYGGQEVNQLFVDASDMVNTEFRWLPFMLFVTQSYIETVGKAIDSRGDIPGSLDDWQSAIVDYAKAQGFTIADQ